MLVLSGVLGISGCIESDPSYVDPEGKSGTVGNSGSGAGDGGDGDDGSGGDGGGSSDTSTGGGVGTGDGTDTTPGTGDTPTSTDGGSGDPTTSGSDPTTGPDSTEPPQTTTGPVTSTSAPDTTTTEPMTTTSAPDMTTTGPPPEESESLVAGPGLGSSIPDSDYDGTLGSMRCLADTITANGVDTVSGITLVLGIDHPWLGDLVVKVESPAGTIVGVLSRAGTNESADDGAGLTSGGIGVDLVSSDRVQFDETYANDAELMGQGLSNDQAACKDDSICNYFPNGDSIAGGGFDDFTGESAVGQWRVCIGDSGWQDSGTIDFMRLTIRQVP